MLTSACDDSSPTRSTARCNHGLQMLEEVCSATVALIARLIKLIRNPLHLRRRCSSCSLCSVASSSTPRINSVSYESRAFRSGCGKCSSGLDLSSRSVRRSGVNFVRCAFERLQRGKKLTPASRALVRMIRLRPRCSVTNDKNEVHPISSIDEVEAEHESSCAGPVHALLEKIRYLERRRKR